MKQLLMANQVATKLELYAGPQTRAMFKGERLDQLPLPEQLDRIQAGEPGDVIHIEVPGPLMHHICRTEFELPGGFGLWEFVENDVDPADMFNID